MNKLIRGLATACFVEGDGETVVLLHGWGSNAQSFRTLASSLAANYRVVSLDFPGFGGSELPPNDWDVNEYALFLQEALEKLKVENPRALIGHSFGGRVAIKAVARGYIQPEKLILLDSAGVKPGPTLRTQAFKLAAKAGKLATALPPLSAAREKLKGRLHRAAGSSDYLQAGKLKGTFLKVINEDLVPDARKISMPTLLIWGSDDKDTPLEDGKILQAAITGSRLERVEGAGHFSYLDQPEVVAKLIRKFL